MYDWCLMQDFKSVCKKKDANPFKVITFVVMMDLIVSELTHIIFFLKKAPTNDATVQNQNEINFRCKQSKQVL